MVDGSSSNPLGDPNERREWIPAYAIILQVLSTVMIGLRLMAHLRKLGGGFGIDDAFLIAGWVFATVMTTLAMVGAIHFGLDRHSSAFTSTSMAVNAQFIGWFGQVIYLLSANFTKLAVLLFYRRLVSTTIKTYLMWAIRIAIVFTVLYTFVFTVLLFFECKPLEALWMRFDIKYRLTHKFDCPEPEALIAVSGALSVIGDFYSLFIPGLMFAELKLPKRQKIGLYAIFTAGILVVGAGIARTVYITGLTHTLDPAYVGANASIASVTEVHLALICACAPALRALFKGYFRSPHSRYGSNVTKTLGIPSGSMLPSRATLPSSQPILPTEIQRPLLHQKSPSSVSRHHERAWVQLLDDQEKMAARSQFRTAHPPDDRAELAKQVELAAQIAHEIGLARVAMAYDPARHSSSDMEVRKYGHW